MLKEFDFHAPWKDLPKKKRYNDVDIYFKVTFVSGVVYDDVRFFVQVIREGMPCQVTFDITRAFLGSDHCEYRIYDSLFDNFHLYFSPSLPVPIREKFPLLNKMASNENIYKYLSFSSFKPASFFTCQMSTKALQKRKLTDVQANYIINVVDTVIRAEREYNIYKKSRFYHNLKKLHQEQMKKQESLQTMLGLYKTLRFGILCYNLLNGTSDSYAEGSDTIDFNNIDLNQLDLPNDQVLSQLENNPALVDFLISPSESIPNSNKGGDISFGNSYDENALKFLEQCNKEGVELPNTVNTSTNTYTTEVERGYYGGFSETDKMLVRHKLDDLLKSGKLSQSKYDSLKSGLSKT
jgi:hypothetical protein